jgi:uncharacterized coiled-coil DUF342 family protein
VFFGSEINSFYVATSSTKYCREILYRKEIEEHKTRFEQLTKEHQELVKLNSDLNNEINNISKELSEIQEKVY